MVRGGTRRKSLSGSAPYRNTARRQWIIRGPCIANELQYTDATQLQPTKLMAPSTLKSIPMQRSVPPSLALVRRQAEVSHKLHHPTLSRLDMVGALLSFGCAVHCIAMPLLVVVLPFVGWQTFGTDVAESHAHQSFDRWMFITTITIASVSLLLGARAHRDPRPLGLLLLGVTCFALGGFHVHDIQDGIFVGIGGFLLAGAHLLNRKLHRACSKGCCS